MQLTVTRAEKGAEGLNGPRTIETVLPTLCGEINV